MATSKQSQLQEAQVRRAVIALQQYAQKQRQADKAALFEHTDIISVQIGLKKIPQEGRNKPLRVDVPHSLYKATDGCGICIIVKDTDKKKIKEKLAEKPVDGVEKIIGLQKLRTEFKKYEYRRKLCAEYDLFLADDRILPMLPKVLGKAFFQKKKQPVPVKLDRGTLATSICKARDSTYLYIGWGPCSAVRIARTNMSIDEIVENVLEGVKNAVKQIPKQWKNVQAIHIKTTDSPALPVYNDLPEMPLSITVASDKALAPKTKKNSRSTSATDGEVSSDEESDGESKIKSVTEKRKLATQPKELDVPLKKVKANPTKKRKPTKNI